MFSLENLETRAFDGGERRDNHDIKLSNFGPSSGSASRLASISPQRATLLEQGLKVRCSYNPQAYHKFNDTDV